jgi:hypothetical protein
LKHVGALRNGLTYLSRYNLDWFCRTNDGIRFNRVVSAANKVNNFDLIIEAWNSNGKDAKYEAEVYVMDLGAKRALLSFQPAN